MLVSESSTVNGYSLMERPIRGDEDTLTDVDPSAAAKQVQSFWAATWACSRMRRAT